MSNAIRFHQTGGPEVLKLEQVDIGEPGPGQARVRHSAIAVNFIDVYFRSGRYPAQLPSGLGSDAVGVVEAIGTGVNYLNVGDRVGYLLGPQGAYSDARVMPADVLIKSAQEALLHGRDQRVDQHSGVGRVAEHAADRLRPVGRAVGGGVRAPLRVPRRPAPQTRLDLLERCHRGRTLEAVVGVATDWRIP